MYRNAVYIYIINNDKTKNMKVAEIIPGKKIEVTVQACKCVGVDKNTKKKTIRVVENVIHEEGFGVMVVSFKGLKNQYRFSEDATEINALLGWGHPTDLNVIG